MKSDVDNDFNNMPFIFYWFIKFIKYNRNLDKCWETKSKKKKTSVVCPFTGYTGELRAYLSDPIYPVEYLG